MKKRLLLAAGMLLTRVAIAATPAEVTSPVREFIDAFNKGNLAAAYAFMASGPTVVTDEFAPFEWRGAQAAQQWVAAYDAHAKATGVSDGHVTYADATRVEIEGELAYVVMPTVYLYKEHSRAMQEEGSITAVMVQQGGRWKIKSWTWTGVKPHPAA